MRTVDGSPAPLGPTAAREPTLIAREARARRGPCARSWISRW